MRFPLRGLIFPFFIVVFLAAAYGAILYAQGWRWEETKRALVKTGALFIDPYPEDARVTLDGKQQKHTSVLSPNAFFDRLKPGRYRVRAEKEGYRAWEKTLEVFEQKITTARRVLLIPEKPAAQEVFRAEGTIQKIFFSDSPNPQAVAGYELQNDTIFALLVSENKNGAWRVAREDIVPKNSNVGSISWTEDGNAMLVKLSAPEHAPASPQWVVIQIPDNLKKPVATLALPEEIREAQFWSSNTNEIVVLAAGITRSGKDFLKILAINRTTLTLKTLSDFSKKITALAVVAPDRALFLDESGLLFELNGQYQLAQMSFEAAPPLRDMPVFFNTIIARNEPGRIALLTSEKILFLFDAQSKSFAPVAEGVEDALFSKNGKKILWRTRFELWVTYLELQYEDPRHDADERELLVRLLNPIRDIAWYPEEKQYHALFSVGNAVTMTELDGRDMRNGADVFMGEMPRLIAPFNNGILIADANSLMHVSLPIPPKYDLGILSF